MKVKTLTREQVKRLVVICRQMVHFLPVIVAIAAIVLGVIFIWGLTAPGGSKSESLIIERGMGRWDVASVLYDRGFIRSKYHFFAAVTLSGRTIKAGTYTVNSNDPLMTHLKKLTRGQDQQLTITLPEGWRREQIAERLAENGIDKAQFLALTADSEGYLFPDTYYFPVEVTPEQVAARLRDTFTQRTAELPPTRDQVILASIIEREARNDSERGLIAGIYSNRLKRGMKLDADPTVQYARDTNLIANGQAPTQFWQAITVQDYSGVRSPYNTYLTVGLPPGPIANPGLASLRAAVNPEPTNALYFFHTREGSIVTSRSLDEHAANKRKHLR